MLVEIEPCLEAFEPVGPVQTRRVQGLGLGLARGLIVGPLAGCSNPEQMDLRPDGCKFGLVWLEALLFFRNRAVAGNRQGLNHRELGGWAGLAGRPGRSRLWRSSFVFFCKLLPPPPAERAWTGSGRFT